MSLIWQDPICAVLHEKCLDSTTPDKYLLNCLSSANGNKEELCPYVVVTDLEQHMHVPEMVER